MNIYKANTYFDTFKYTHIKEKEAFSRARMKTQRRCCPP